MVLTDKHTNQQVLGCIIRNPLLLAEYEIDPKKDFEGNKVAALIFVSIKNLLNLGAKTLSVIEIDQDISHYEAWAAMYEKEKGLDFLKDAYDIAQEGNFKYYYNRMRKLTLLRRLKKEQYDISYYYKDEFDTLREENETIVRFDEATIEDILNHVEGKYNLIKQEFINGERQDGLAATGIEELIDELLENPEIGTSLCGDFWNTAVMGARKGKFYIKSASSGCGKSRIAVMDMIKICFPIHWSFEKGSFVVELDENGEVRPAQKALVITTELAKDEIQTMVLAYLSGVNESHILMGDYQLGELERVRFAAKIVKQYENDFFIDEVPDPNLSNIEALIRKYVTVEKVEYIAYDYIFSSPSLLAQFERTGVREDVVLELLSTKLKDLAKDYQVFIETATQVNGEAMNSEGFKNETCIRSAKAIVNKADVGAIVVKVGEKEYNSLVVSLKEAGKIPRTDKMPTHRYDLYKNRRGQYKNVSVWSYINLGTGEWEDLYVTTSSGKIIKEFSIYKDITYREELMSID